MADRRTLSERGAKAAKPGELAQNVRLFLRFRERGELFLDVTPVEYLVMAHSNSFRVANVNGARGEQLHHDQVFGGARAEVEARRKLEWSRSLDDAMFERQGTKRDVDANSTWRVQQEDSRPERKLRGLGVPRVVVRESRTSMNEASPPKPVSSVRSTSRVTRAWLQRCTAIPPKRQELQPWLSQKSCIARAASNRSMEFTDAASPGDAAFRPDPMSGPVAECWLRD